MTRVEAQLPDDPMVRRFTSYELAYLAQLAQADGEVAPIFGLPKVTGLDDDLQRTCIASLAVRGMVDERSGSLALDEVAGAVGVTLATATVAVALEFVDGDRVDALCIVQSGVLWRISLLARPCDVVEVGLVDADVPLGQLVGEACAHFVLGHSDPRGVSMCVARGSELAEVATLVVLKDGSPPSLKWRIINSPNDDEGELADIADVAPLVREKFASIGL